jgi:hypothetical protein
VRSKGSAALRAQLQMNRPSSGKNIQRSGKLMTVAYHSREIQRFWNRIGRVARDGDTVARKPTGVRAFIVLKAEEGISGSRRWPAILPR